MSLSDLCRPRKSRKRKYVGFFDSRLGVLVYVRSVLSDPICRTMRCSQCRFFMSRVSLQPPSPSTQLLMVYCTAQLYLIINALHLPSLFHYILPPNLGAPSRQAYPIIFLHASTPHPIPLHCYISFILPHTQPGIISHLHTQRPVFFPPPATSHVLTHRRRWVTFLISFFLFFFFHQ